MRQKVGKPKPLRRIQFRKVTATLCVRDMKYMLTVLLFVAAVLGMVTATAVDFKFERSKTYDYQCFGDKDYLPTTTAISFNLRQPIVGLQVSNHVNHQLMTRIFAIFLREVLNYKNILIIPLEYTGNSSRQNYELEKLHDTLKLIKYHPELPDMTMINLEIWMSPLRHSIIPATVFDAGPSITPGRVGWFVPKSQVEQVSRTSDYLNFNVFLDPMHPGYKRYIINDELLVNLRRSTDFDEFISPSCVRRSCVTLLAEYKYDAGFVEQHIKEAGAYVNILWLGAKFRENVLKLDQLYRKNYTHQGQRFIVLHWTPSILINAEIEFTQINMPRCEDWKSLENSLCKYELTPVLKYYSQSSTKEGNGRLLHALREFSISDPALQQLQFDYGRLSQQTNNETLATDIYNKVACNWLKHNEQDTSAWISVEPTVTLVIGGIFPITETSRGHQNLVQAVRLAVRAINSNNSILPDYNLAVYENDGQCKADVVMKAFIHYFNVPNMLGVLGPACSETVEPIAGISRHTNMAVISYSAEGASFVDRQAYPYFFRTIGSNRQYEDAYISLMQRLGWRRVAALTEDGQKFTEYISHMEATMKQRNLDLIVNKKFLSDVTATEMNKHLLDLKQRHAKIIIADIHNRNAELALCEAFKLGMTAYEGYVWFLPSWITKDWKAFNNSANNSCTGEELQMAFEGHLSIMHTPYGEPTSKMQENITIEEWLNTYDRDHKLTSNYTGFAYDAVWAYALAADKLFRENRDYVNNLRSDIVVQRFVELIWKTDFSGLSGRVRFGQGGSRITELNIMQWRQSQFVEVGKYRPNILGTHGNSLHPNGGELLPEVLAIEWLSGVQPPGDGTYDCSFAALAELMSIDCDSAAVVFTVLLCLLTVVIISSISFLFWKRRYDSKLKRSAKIMKTFGIDLLSPSRNKLNTLDKWEIPKENVVVNRRLGEGAFGTVYGGEAQLKADGWTAVAVKTLKAGASTEDRLDFLSEAEAMKRLDHKNIIKLLGVCLQSEPIYTIMEFMLYGDLKTYLLARRHMVNEKITDESDISSKRLTMYAMDVVRGLAYLSEQKYVHRDIACRNCLVNAQRVVKLADFGMARLTSESDYYRFNRKGMLPVRWMSPEALGLGLFTPSSDVWAFAVVLYEIITFGSFPYQGLTNNQVLEYVKSGKTLQIPNGIKPQLEGLIKACWSLEAEKRPTANEIIDYILNYPRLLTPCLDFPGASVEMPQTESDELELLPHVRRMDSTLDILSQTTNFDRHNDFITDMEMSVSSNIDIPNGNIVAGVAHNHTASETFSVITPDGYSIMSPLLMHQASHDSSDSSTQPNRTILGNSPPTNAILVSKI